MANQEEIKKVELQFNQEIEKIGQESDLEQLRIKYLGRKGLLTMMLRSLKDMPLEQRKVIGPMANKLKETFEHHLQIKKEELKAGGEIKQSIDVTRPGKKINLGHLHPLSIVLRQVVDIFNGLGFAVAEGPEIETEYYNFDALNLPAEHPARDMWNTIWLDGSKSQNQKERLLLRTHTSPVQIRYMQSHKPPVRIISPGQVFRFEATDQTHHFQFWQLEGLMIDEDINLGHLRYIIEAFLSRFFGRKIQSRFEPSFFPFVEPGLQFSISCPFCKSKGCSSCQKLGWLEMGGAGMVHPQVLRNVGYDPKKFQGFAFGLGLDRLAMHKYHIPDIRLFYNGDLRFIRQFKL
ncbi:phenylalanine--tRNA ligase subunit alpha [Candidatus Parcubacteria bacterium]|nr:MAG: phenylalanine--tRNA ligase subunit alpha [Candidatus Parcubacteria bacterium]